MASVAMPQLGESVSEGTVVRWLKRVGDPVSVDEPLFEVASDKVNTEYPSLHAGVLRDILVPEGTTVPVGTELARISMSTSNGNSHARAHLHSPVVRRLAREHGVDLGALGGTGRGGRITRTDLLAHLASATAPAPAPAPNRTAGVPFSPLRARIATNLSASKQTAADVFSVIEADMESVHQVRLAARERLARQGTTLTYLPFIAKAAIVALGAFPAVNARIDGTSLVYNDDVHLGIAVDLDERGLVVPVIRNADGLTVTGLARALATIGSAARSATLAASEYSGSTFTITNNGSYGTLMTAPIINLPNVATLSTDVIEERVVPYQGMIAIRRRMYLCMSWDHRAFDGSTAGKFLARLKRELETCDWASQL